MKIKIIVFSLVFACMATTAMAQSTPRVSANQVQDQGKIHRGYHSGQLTGPEAMRLEAEQSAIRHQKRHAHADGVVTYRERCALRHSQNQADRHIRGEKHDGQRRH